MQPLIISGLLSFLLNGVIGFFVFSRNPKNWSNRFFALFSLMVGGWSIGSFLENVIPNPILALGVLRVNYLFGVWLPPLYIHFVYAFSGVARDRKKILIASYVLSGFFTTVVFTPLFIKGLRELQISPYRYLISVPGPIYYAFFVNFAVSMTEVLRTTILAARRVSDPQRKVQIQYLTIANAIAIAGGFEYFSRVFGILSSPPIDDYILAAYIIVLGYAIVRYQLLDIEVIIKRTLQFAGLVGSVVAVVSLVAFVSQDLLARFVTVPRWLSNVFAAMIIAFLYERIRNWLINVTEKYLFQKKYDYKELLKKFSNEVVIGIQDLKKLEQMTVATFTDTMKLEGCSLLLLNKDTRKYSVVANKGLDGQQLEIDEQEPFITFLRETYEPIGQDGHLGKVRFPEAVTNRLKQLNARLCLPLHLHQDLIGVLCLGKMKSDKDYAKDDIDFLQSLANTLAIGVNNSQVVEELKVTQATAAQKEKLAVIGTLSAGINHEICNPLGIVKAQCEAFLLDAEDGILIGKSSQELLERSGSIMRVALKQIDRATAITQKLSNFAKPIKEATLQAVPVEQEVDEVLMLVGHDLKLEKIEVIKEIQPDLPSIVVDRRQLQEVLFNLIRNAGQAINPPGTIWVRAHQHEGDRVRIEISDTGSGIPADKIEKIWDPFFTTKEPGKGTGLGLFIVRQIVERNKGRISLESAPGKGTTFFLDFPATKQAVTAGR